MNDATQGRGGVETASPLHPVLLDRVQQIVSEQVKVSDTLEGREQGGHDLTSVLLETA